jgi:uridine kinase
MNVCFRPYQPQLVAIVGGSGSGKSWLAAELQARLGKEAALLSLDDFYRDRSYLSPDRRTRLNFDHPRAIDWPAFERVLSRSRMGLPQKVPRYDFTTHTQCARRDWWRPKRVVLVEGLWLLRRPSVRRWFGIRIFIECRSDVQLRRRLRRDTLERGRSAASVREQFVQRVAPMHEQYVRPQARWATHVVTSPVQKPVLERLARDVQRLLEGAAVF